MPHDESGSGPALGLCERYTARFGTDVLFDVQYTRDDLGRLTALVETVQGVTRRFEYGYDNAGRLASVTRDGVAIMSYTYDANGNRLFATTQFGSFAATYNERDQMLTYGDTSYTYSPDGELLRSSAASGDTTYSFDVQGALRSVTLPNGGQIEFVLDSAGLRIGKRVNGTIVQRRLYGQALEVLADLDATGNVQARHVFTNRLSSAAYMTKGGRTFRIISDHLGSARIVVDVNTGEIAQALNYDEWGNIILDTNPGFQPFAFTGREFDSETGLYYLRARYYDPRLRRFISEDPVGFEGGLNLYSYVGANPVAAAYVYGLLSPCGETIGFLKAKVTLYTPQDYRSMVEGVAIGLIEKYPEKSAAEIDQIARQITYEMGKGEAQELKDLRDKINSTKDPKEAQAIKDAMERILREIYERIQKQKEKKREKKEREREEKEAKCANK